MSVTTFEKGRSASAGSSAASSGFLNRVAAQVKRYVELSRAERELSQLDDRLLMDIGINRGDIRRMVWGVDARR